MKDIDKKIQNMPRNKQWVEKHWYNKRTCFRSCHLRFYMTG